MRHALVIGKPLYILGQFTLKLATTMLLLAPHKTTPGFLTCLVVSGC